eukprot:TRINITY_DN10751_c1_g1_i4.p1 TRINITY_DN10751_c1_g1~~TRINITY_DN10751_c1_g1_i4.p1  ORF type:complete len:259 (-),score=34.57 TRINITY_DN10751_c1_g1_i4:363-1139(-)
MRDTFKVMGEDADWETVKASLNSGETSNDGFQGPKVKIDHKIFEGLPDAENPIPRHMRIHTLGNSSVGRKDFDKWSRWYQEDGNTQIIRIYKGETNMRNNRDLKARCEAWGGKFDNCCCDRGEMHEWRGLITLLQPTGATIFQNKSDCPKMWGFHLRSTADGDIILAHRRVSETVSKDEKDKVVASGVIGKPVHVRVKDNGHKYFVWVDGELMGEGEYERDKDCQSCFRWGMYVGTHEVESDGIIAFTGVTFGQCECE